jgi:hypothetical protein
MRANRAVVCLILTILGGTVGVAAAGAELPAARDILRNGDFADDAQNARHWVTYGQGQFALFSLQPGEGQDEGRVLSIDVKEVSEQHWLAQLRQGLTEPLRRGEVLFCRFEYKITPGYVFQCYWQKEEPPWPKFMSLRITGPTDEWHECSFAMRVPQDVPSRGSSLALHLAEKKGTIQFRKFAALVYPPEVNPEDLPCTCSAVLGGDDADRAWREKASQRIETVRKGQVRLRLVRQDRPLANTAVRIEQKRGSFWFGVSVPAAILLDDAAPGPAAAELRKRLEGVEDKVGKYRARVLDPQLFGMISPTDVFDWVQEESWAERGPALVADLVEKGFTVRGQALFCPAFRAAPPACRQMEAADLQQAVEGYVARQVKRHAGKLHQWDVLHAPLTCHEIYDKTGEQSLVRAFQVARENDANALLLLSDDRALVSPSTEHLDELVSLTAWLRSQGAEVQALALQARFGLPYIAPQAVEDRLNQAASATGLPIVISSLEVTAQTEALQAERLEDLLVLFFSHPAVAGVCLGELWEALLPPPGKSALFRQGFVIKEAGKIVERYLRESWRTSVDAQSGADGWLTVPGFHGQYEAILRAEGTEETRTFSIPAPQGEAVLQF